MTSENTPKTLGEWCLARGISKTDPRIAAGDALLRELNGVGAYFKKLRETDPNLHPTEPGKSVRPFSTGDVRHIAGVFDRIDAHLTKAATDTLEELAKHPAIQKALFVGLEAKDKALREDVNDPIGAFNVGALTFLAALKGEAS